MAAGSTNPKTIVCVGVTGAGKSALCNCILGEPFFKESPGFKSATSKASFHDCKLGENCCRVIDTVGFLDNRLTEQDKEAKFGEFADLASYGVDVFLLVMKFGRFTAEQENQFNLFKEQLGGHAPQRLLNRTILVFTQISPDKLAEGLGGDDLPQNLKDVLKQVKPVVVECKYEVAESLSAVQKAVQACITENENIPKYSNEILEEAKSRHEKLQARIDQLKSSDRKAFLTKARCGLSNGTSKYKEVMQDVEKAEVEEQAEQAERKRHQCEEESRRHKHELDLKAMQSREKERQFEHERQIEREQTKRKKDEQEHEMNMKKEEEDRADKRQRQRERHEKELRSSEQQDALIKNVVHVGTAALGALASC